MYQWFIQACIHSSIGPYVVEINYLNHQNIYLFIKTSYEYHINEK